MSNYHGDIMNIPVDDDLMNYIAKTDAEVFAYKVGHRDARHEAAELGNQADCVIEELRSTLEELWDDLNGVANIDNVLTVVRMREKIDKALQLGGN